MEKEFPGDMYGHACISETDQDAPEQVEDTTFSYHQDGAFPETQRSICAYFLIPYVLGCLGGSGYCKLGWSFNR